MFFKSKLAAMLVSLAAFLTVLSAGAIAIAYTILPNIGVFSFGEKIIIGIYFAACLTTLFYAAYSSYVFWVMLRKEYSISGGILAKFLWVPVIGSFAILYMTIDLARKHSKKLCNAAIFLACLTGIYILSVMTLFVDEKGVDLILLVSLIFTVVNGSIFLYIVSKLSTVPVGRGAKVLIGMLCLILAGAIAFNIHSRIEIERKVSDAKIELEKLYGNGFSGWHLKNLYYHGLEPNYKKFKDILPPHPEDEKSFAISPDIDDELWCFFKYSLTSKELDAKLDAWLKKKKSFLQKMDAILEQEKYFKVSEDIRNYHGLLLGAALPAFNKFRNWVRVAFIRIKAAMREKDFSKAMRLLKQTVRVRSYLLDDHFLISYLVALAIDGYRIYSTEVILSNGGLTQEQLNVLLKFLKDSEVDWEKYFETAMYSNAVVTLDGAEHFADAIYSIPQRGLFFDREKNEAVGRFLLAPVRKMNQEEVLYVANTFMILTNKEKGRKEIKQRIDNVPEKFLFAHVVVCSFYAVWDKTLLCMSRHLAAETAIQVELFKLKYGKLPDKLSDLVPEFMPKVPLDYYSGKPLKYIHGDFLTLLVDARKKYSLDDKPVPVKVNGYTIYSSGLDKVDSKGISGKYNGKYHDDISFKVIYGVVK